MAEGVHLEAVERVLATLFQKGDTLLSSFMFGKPGAPIWDRRMGTEVFVDRKAYTQALLFIRQNGAPYLRSISISDLWSLVTKFVTEHFWYIGRSTFLPIPDEPYSARVTQQDKQALADALAASVMFNPKTDLTLYPLIPIRVADNFECARFFLIAADRLDHSFLPASAAHSPLEPGSFPPLAEWDGIKQRAVAWLGVRSPLPLFSDKLAAAILGAVALTSLSRNRYMLSGRGVFGGKCTISDRFTVSYSEDAHTPPIMHDIVLTARDHSWLEILVTLLDAQDKPSRSKVRALEYFYRAWFLDPRERFPALCMSLDSLIAASERYTAAALKFVKDTISSSIDEKRLRLLLRIRGAVIHGAAPDVYESEHYAEYYVDYGADPIRDLELVVAKCLREAVFEGKLGYHPDPNADIVAEMQAKGRLPKQLAPAAIIVADE
jgi:hypothetical protein